MPVYKDVKRGTWYVKFKYKDWTDNIKDVTKRGFPIKREAVQWERDFKAQKQASPDISFENFVQVYRQDRQPRLKVSTV